MKPFSDFSNLLVTDEGTLVFLSENRYRVTGIKEFDEKLYFMLRP